MSTTDEVIGSIDHALRDTTLGRDAMRWMPGGPPADWRVAPVAWPPANTEAIGRISDAFGHVTVTFSTSVGQFVKEVSEAMRKVVANAWPQSVARCERDRLRRQALHAAYRTRARRRTRSRR